MDENERSIHSLIIRYLVAHTQCSGCGRRYAARDVRIYDHRGDIWLASVTCGHCGLQGLVMAAIATRDVQDVEGVVDLEAEEGPAFEEMGPISGDEVLNFHCLVEEFDGDLVQLLEEGDGRS
jgi:hypothetical protein